MTCFCTFWQSAFSVTCFGMFFGGGNKCVSVNVCGGWCWNGTCLRMLCVVGFQFVLQLASGRPLPACVWRDGTLHAVCLII